MDINTIINEIGSVWCIGHSITTTQLCAWLTEDEKQLYRDIAFPNEAIIISTVANTKTYDLPTDCPADRIQYVVLVEGAGETEYEYRPMTSEDTTGNWFTILLDTMIMLSEAPTTSGLDLIVFYNPKPATFSAGNLTVSPSYPEDYHEWSKWTLAARVKKAQAAQGGGDMDLMLANQYEAEANAVFEKMKKQFTSTPIGGFQVQVVW